MKEKTKINPYFKVTYKMLGLEGIRSAEQLLLAHIHNFGTKGCWQSNKQLADKFNTSPSTITRRLKKLHKYIIKLNPQGAYRIMWSTTNYNKRPNNISKNAEVPMQKCVSNISNSADIPKQNCVTYNNSIIKNITDGTIASPCPRPSESGSAATPQQQGANPIGHLLNSIGNIPQIKSKWVPLSDEEFAKERDRQKKALCECEEKLKGKNNERKTEQQAAPCA
jgi:hypothetical protein